MIDYFAALLSAIGAALQFDAATALSVPAELSPWAVPLGVMVLAAASSMVGAGIVLALNNVRGPKLLVAVTSAMVGYLLTYLALAAGVWLAGSVVLGTELPVAPLVQAVMISAAPLAFNFLVLLPYTGPGIERLLRIWSFIILWSIVSYEFSAGRWSSLLITAVGGLAMVGVIRTAGRSIAAIRDRVWLLITGQPLLLSAEGIRDAFPLPAGDQA